MGAREGSVAAGNGKGIGVLGRHIKEISEAADPAEVRALRVDPAATSTTVVVLAPAVFTDHAEIGLSLLLIEGV